MPGTVGRGCLESWDTGEIVTLDTNQQQDQRPVKPPLANTSSATSLDIYLFIDSSHFVSKLSLFHQIVARLSLQRQCVIHRETNDAFLGPTRAF